MEPLNNSVFVGNIPYDVTEDDLINLFRQFGEVVRFRLVTDPVTGRGKGYGFCDFGSSDSADAAKRMSNVLSISGRALRIDNASQNSIGVGTTGYRSGSTTQSLKQARDLDMALAQLSIGEVYDILVDVKAWVKKDPDAVKEILAQRPVLAQALLKMQETMGMLQTSPPAELSFGSTPQGSNQPSQLQSQGSSMASMPNMSSINPPMGGYVPGAPMPPSIYNQPPGYPPQYYPQMPYGGNPYPMPPQSLPGLAGPPIDPQQEMLMRILMMSDDQVSRLSPQEQDQVRAIRMQRRV